MKKYIICLFSVLAFAGCSDGDDNMPVIKPATTGTFTDIRDGSVYICARYGDLEWMTANFRYVPASGTFRPILTPSGAYDDPANHEFYAKYGGLYNYETAAAAVAGIAGGWRIATDEDWQKLEKLFGMGDGELAAKGARGSHVAELMRQDESGSGFALLLAGFYTTGSQAGYYDEAAVGYYWSSTLDPEKDNGLSRFYRKVFYNSGKVTRESTGGGSLFSVRLVRDAN